MEKKRCNKCSDDKVLSDFHKDKSRKDGLSWFCKPCHLQGQKEKRDKYPGICKVDREKYYKKHKVKHLQKCKLYREKHPDKNKEYYSKNKKRMNKMSLISHNQRYKTDPFYKTLCLLRGRMNKIFRGIVKSQKSRDLIGCDRECLLKHLESQFVEGMTWNNQGEWHIDHIKPCAAFDLSKEEEQKACFHYTNLQPLWAKDNNEKRAYYNGINYKYNINNKNL